MMEKAAKLKLAGCTVFRGLQGYGSRVRGRERRLLISVSEAINLPVIITIIDTEEQIKRVLPFLEKNLTHGVATLDDVKMLATDFVKERFENLWKSAAIQAFRNKPVIIGWRLRVFILCVSLGGLFVFLYQGKSAAER